MENEELPPGFLSLTLTYKRKIVDVTPLTLLKISKIIKCKKNPFFSHDRSSSSLSISMATSSETPFSTDQSATSGLLEIKDNQNMILDLDLLKYDAFLQPLIEFLRHSLLANTLSNYVHVPPLVHLSKAFTTACYEESSATILFAVGTQQSTTTRLRA
ncbi:unnamed protein product [Lactuca saligna]|uniref:Uncharacterized protein n=1 Tax=Lactuca saligna TaxID=75948 RepID=A0AA36DYY4_LACSI|nr:unnamed protein product [Lactuca saligna]